MSLEEIGGKLKFRHFKDQLSQNLVDIINLDETLKMTDH